MTKKNTFFSSFEAFFSKFNSVYSSLFTSSDPIFFDAIGVRYLQTISAQFIVPCIYFKIRRVYSAAKKFRGIMIAEAILPQNEI